MLPDTTIKDYYLQFINNAKIDISRAKDNIITITELRDKVFDYIYENKETFNYTFQINLNDYNKEWIHKEYNSAETLYNKCILILRNITNGLIPSTNKIVLLQVIKYCNYLRNLDKLNRLINIANTRKNIKFNTYRKYVTMYYNKVHKCVLEGMGYKFNYGIGTYVINHWKMDPSKMKHKKHIDFAATNARKKELIAKGIKLYDDKEAAWYKARHIPYTGVDYRVFKDSTDWYEFTFIKSNIFKSSNLEYKRTEYVSTKYRGMSYKDMADKLCKTLDDVYDLQVDIKYKLNIILYKDPTKYLNFIRNAEQCKYMRGAHNS